MTRFYIFLTTKDDIFAFIHIKKHPSDSILLQHFRRLRNKREGPDATGQITDATPFFRAGKAAAASRTVNSQSRAWPSLYMISPYIYYIMYARTLYIIIRYNDIFLRKDLVQWKRLFIFADKS